MSMERLSHVKKMMVIRVSDTDRKHREGPLPYCSENRMQDRFPLIDGIRHHHLLTEQGVQLTEKNKIKIFKAATKLLVTIGVFFSPPAVGNLINEAKTMCATRCKRSSFLIHFSLCYNLFFPRNRNIYSK